jgi:hypothetical protein
LMIVGVMKRSHWNRSRNSNIILLPLKSKLRPNPAAAPQR